MSNTSTTWFHGNHYNAQAACEHCEGIIRHEPWCITLDPEVYYAYQIVAEPGRLTVGDALILHSLGVIWGQKCDGKCRPRPHGASGVTQALPLSTPPKGAEKALARSRNFRLRSQRSLAQQ